MQKLKLQMQMTTDGFVATPDGQLDWMTWNMDEKLKAFVMHLAETSGVILMGRKMAPGFVEYWEHALTQPGAESSFAPLMVNTPKVAFSRTLNHIDGKNVRVENRDLKEAVNQLKQTSAKDLIVYGGATFVSSLIEIGLIDELHLFVNPVAIGNGMRIFKGRTQLSLSSSTAYPCGIVVNTYQPK